MKRLTSRILHVGVKFYEKCEIDHSDAVFLVVCSGVVRAQIETEEVIKVETSLVTIPVIVSDRQSRYIPGLKSQNFSVFQDGEKQQIEFFAAEESPINVAILLDTSRSTQDILEEIKSAAIDFIKTLRPNDRCLIVSFDNDVEVLSRLTSNQKELEAAVWNAQIGRRIGTVMQGCSFDVVNRQFQRSRDVKPWCC